MPAAAVVTLMLTRIACPNCGHIGAANAASLPRVLICSQCGHGAFINSGRPLDIGRPGDKADLSRLSDAELVAQLADQAKALGIQIDLNYRFLQQTAVIDPEGK